MKVTIFVTDVPESGKAPENAGPQLPDSAGRMLWHGGCYSPAVMNSVWRPRLGWIAALFVSLMLIATAERRLADLHFNTVGTVALENAEEPEGDQIGKRLIIIEDDAPPPTLSLTEVRHASADVLPLALHPIPYVRVPEPRAPPVR